MNKNKQIEIKTGIFVTCGLALTMAAILLLGGKKFFQKNIHHTTHCARVDGLISGAKVILQGLFVGTVDHISLDPLTRQIEVQFSISEEAHHWLHEGAIVEIITQGVLGDKFLSLESGAEEQPALQPNSDIPFRSSRDLNQFISQGDQLIKSAETLLASFNRLLNSFESDRRNESFFKAITTTAVQLASITTKINQLDIAPLQKSLEDFSLIMKKINHGTGTIGALVNESELHDNLNNLLKGANRNRIIRNLIRQTIQDSN
jgi:phospholipid/cholesterol/gamma-HCH transport system substrate-binding protein